METGFCLGIFSALLIGHLRVLHISTAVSTCEQVHPKGQLPHIWQLGALYLGHVTLLHCWSLGFCSREDRTGDLLDPHTVDISEVRGPVWKRRFCHVLSSPSFRKGVGCHTPLLGRGFPPTTSKKGQCQMLDLLVGRVPVAQSLACSFTPSCGHTFSAPHSGQGDARAAGGRETGLGCSFVLSGSY